MLVLDLRAHQLGAGAAEQLALVDQAPGDFQLELAVGRQRSLVGEVLGQLQRQVAQRIEAAGARDGLIADVQGVGGKHLAAHVGQRLRGLFECRALGYAGIAQRQRVAGLQMALAVVDRPIALDQQILLGNDGSARIVGGRIAGEQLQVAAGLHQA
ncbi:MAG: hypothetical protein RR326_03665, partial [Stenotrophomonas sp.]